MRPQRIALIIVLFGALLQPMRAHAFLQVRVSVKLFVNWLNEPPRPDGEPDYDTFQEVRNAFTYYNSLLDQAGWGIRLELTDVTAVTEAEGGGTYEDLDPRNSTNRNRLEFEAKLPGSTLHYRPDAINVYINRKFSGMAGAHLPLLGDVIFMGIQGGVSNGPVSNRRWVKTLLHETGHALGLWHTQGRYCGTCDEPARPSDDCHVPGDDECNDTIPDVACWNVDQISQANFGGLSYSNLSIAQAWQVDTVSSNVMSYHNPEYRYILTHDQREKMVDSANLQRHNVASGYTIFVDKNNQCFRPEDLSSPFDNLASHTPGWSWGMRFGLGVTLDPQNPPGDLPPAPCPPGVTCPLTVCLGGPYKNIQAAVDGAASGDRLQIKSGTYGDRPTISKHLTLATDRGPVFIGRP